ncbi:MAG TPA: UDP-N-acetylglucosamine 2-epimerase (non-hydrolyzing) [Pyrinomonadaceae bacterium]|nr:UDP-N-acetylglucosamine 2-epimerase (non-hydrolyzing) [Pyrinomonadaceae bacterium]
MKRILHVVGARPNYMKIAPIVREMARFPDDFAQTLVHTGQHYDDNMSKLFFDELDMPRPDINLEVGSGSHAAQTAEVMLRFEPVLKQFNPDWVLVPGDVNSTLACALVAVKLGVKVAHIEAGLRSFDRTMPEEINRLLTDQISDLLLTHSPEAADNLIREGIVPEKIHLVGNTMIDTLVRLMPLAEERWPALREQFGFERFVLVTLHRPSNVDAGGGLTEIVSALNEISEEIPVIFPVHPRTQTRIGEHSIDVHKNVRLAEPIGYIDFLALQAHAGVVVTDSGGVQEETTFLGVPCLTVRPNTERPVTIKRGTNKLVPRNRDAIVSEIQAATARTRAATAQPPEFWDGKAAERIVSLFRSLSGE